MEFCQVHTLDKSTFIFSRCRFRLSSLRSIALKRMNSCLRDEPWQRRTERAAESASRVTHSRDVIHRKYLSLLFHVRSQNVTTHLFVQPLFEPVTLLRFISN